MRTQTIILLFAITLISVSTEAQISLGLKSNIIFNDTEFSSGTIDLDKTVKSMQGYSIGGFAEYELNSNWSLSSELLYKHIGFQIVESTSFGLFGIDVPIGATLKTTVNYIEMPVLFKYRHKLGNVQAFVEAGPSINYAINGRVNTTANSFLDIDINETELKLDTESYNRINTAANIGLGITYPYSQDLTMSAGIRYTKDLSDSVELPIVDAAVRNNSIGIGISIGKRF